MTISRKPQGVIRADRRVVQLGTSARGHILAKFLVLSLLGASVIALHPLRAVGVTPAPSSPLAGAARQGVDGAASCGPPSCKDRASQASVLLDCHGGQPPASYPKPYPCGRLLVTGNFYTPYDSHTCPGNTGYCRERPLVTFSGGSIRVYTSSLDDTASLYDPLTQRWSPTANLQNTCSGVPWKDGNNTGTTPSGVSIPCHSYRTATLLDPPGCHGGTPAVASGYPCGTVLVQGPYDDYKTTENFSDRTKPGYDAYGGDPTQPNRPSGDSQLYNPATGTWQQIVAPVQEHGHMGLNSKATLLANGTVLVVPGGIRGSSLPDNGPPDPGLLYDPSAKDSLHPLGTWFATPPMSQAAYDSPVAGLSDGNRVLVITAGGVPEIYDPTGISLIGRGSWIPTGPVPYLLGGETATTLSDGRVLVVGGNILGNRLPTNLFGADVPGSPSQRCKSLPYYCGSNSVFIYDPATGMWSNGAPLQHRRTYHSANLLPNGKVLVAGGYSENFDANGDPVGVNILDSTEIYDPATATWTDGPPLSHARGSHTATVVPFAGCNPGTLGAPDYLCARLVTIGGVILGWDAVQGVADVQHADPEPTAEQLVPPPLITGLTPNRGPAGRATPVKVSGFALAGSNLSIDGAPAPPCAASGCPAAGDPDTSALMMAPPRNTNAEVSVPVKATTALPGGQVLESNSLPFTYFISPVLSGIDPVCGPEAGGTTVTLTGLQLTGSDQVFFGDQAVKPNILSDTKLSVQTPPHTGPGAVQVSVGKTGDRSDTTAAFTYPCPSIPPVRPPDAPIADAGVGGSNSSTTKSITGGFPVGPGGGHAGGVPSSAGAPSSALAPGSSLAPSAAGGPGLGAAPSQAAGFGVNTSLSPGAALSPGLSPPVPGTSTASAVPGLVAPPGVNQEGGPAVQYMMTGRSPDKSTLMPILPGLIMLATLGCIMIGRKRPRPSVDLAPIPAYAYAYAGAVGGSIKAHI